MNLPPLYLKRREERRLRAGHPWVFSNEVDVVRSPLAAFAPGDAVNVHASSGQVLATAYVNPATLICARVVSRRANRPLDAEMLVERLSRAMALRARLRLGECHRLAYGESDGIPGLVVDRHGDVLVAQLSTAGIERLRGAVVDALRALVEPRALLLRNDGPGRRLEGLAPESEWALGDPVRSVTIEENGTRFEIDPEHGQKTGWYYDQRLNRARAAHHARDRRMLDLFSYRGGFGVQAANAGAREVLCVDTSEEALDGARTAARTNGCAGRVDVLRADAFDALKQLADDKRRFDLVITDPPAFARRKRDLPAAREAYRRLNRMAMRVLAGDGLLLAASCSSHLDVGGLRDALRGAARAAGRRLAIVEQGHQGPDHPVHPALAESDYLNSLLVAASA